MGAALRLIAAVALTALARTASAEDLRRTQEIVFPELAARAQGDAPFALAAKSTSGLAVSFELISGPATLDGKTLSLTGAAGLVVVRATQGGSDLFRPATPAERAFPVNPRPEAPRFTMEPAAAAAEIGGIVVLTAAVSGEPKPTLQWRRDGRPIEGARDPALTIAPTALADAGAYDVVAMNATGSVTSSVARVTVARRRQEIIFRGASSGVAGVPIPLGADASSGLPVSFEVVAGTATLGGSMLAAQAGAVVVRASQAGNAEYEAATPVTRTFSVSPPSTGPHTP